MDSLSDAQIQWTALWQWSMDSLSDAQIQWTALWQWSVDRHRRTLCFRSAKMQYSQGITRSVQTVSKLYNINERASKLDTVLTGCTANHIRCVSQSKNYLRLAGFSNVFALA
eukprot:scpid26078/ scgid21956/ 